MRTENGHDTSMVEALSENKQHPVLRTSGTDIGPKGHKELTVAVTTAPRQDCTLAYCLASIEACGWNPIAFAEPGATETDYQTVWNESKKGIWHNWLNSCRWCLENTSTEFIMTVQDDSLFHPDSKIFVDSIAWPENCGFVSLYTPRHYSVLKTGGIRGCGVNRIGTKSLWGSLALIFERKVLERVVASPRVPAWFGYRTRTNNEEIMERRRKDTSLVANSDTVIGKIINDLKLWMYFVEPSPVHHIADYSTIAHGGRTGNRNCFPCSDFDKPLMEQVFNS